MMPVAIYTHLAVALLGAVLAFSGAWQIQDWRLGGQISALQAKHATERAQAQADARAAEIAHNTRLQEAQDAATSKEIALRRDAAGARRERDGLRDELASTRAQLASATRSSLVDRAAALTDVFEQCASEYTALAEKADRHAIDAGKLWSAWPMNPRRPDGGTTESTP